MSGFYKKAVVWLGLNEDYPDGYPDDVSMPHDGEPGMNPPDAAPGRGPGPGQGASELSGDSGEARGPRPRPTAVQPERRQPENRQPEARLSNPLRANASHDRSEGTVRAVPMETENDGSAAAEKSGAATGRTQEPSTGTVRAVPMAQTTKPQVVVPKSFNDAQDVADMFRDKQPVIVNMQSAERDLARRLIDFSSGLCYGLGGQMEKVAKDVYLLTPTDVEVAEADRDKF